MRREKEFDLRLISGVFRGRLGWFSLRHDALLGLWALFLVLIPFYFFSSGRPQVSDYVMILLAGLVFLGIPFHFPREIKALLLSCGMLVLYIALVNWVWLLQLRSLLYSWNTLFYVYNLTVLTVFCVLYLRYGKRLLQVTSHVIAGAVFLQTALSFFFIEMGRSRQILFFNNPNQLGYFAVLATVFFYMGSKFFPYKKSYQVLFYLCTFYLTVLSVSSAALVAMGLFLIILLLKSPKIALLLMTALLVIFLLNPNPLLYEKVERRIITMGQAADDSLAGRGYDRIVNHPEYLFFGAGEGINWRFETRVGREFHSSFGTLLFSYGIVGLVLFLNFLYQIYKEVGIRPYLELVPVFFYGFTHHGLRWPLFWLLLAFVFLLQWGKRERRPVLVEVAEDY